MESATVSRPTARIDGKKSNRASNDLATSCRMGAARLDRPRRATETGALTPRPRSKPKRSLLPPRNSLRVAHQKAIRSRARAVQRLLQLRRHRQKNPELREL